MARTCRRCLAVCVWKTWLILVTLLCTIGGLVICVASIWVMADDSFAEGVKNEEKLHGVRTGAIVLLVAGLFVILINIVGLVGTFFRHQRMLLAHFIMVFIFLLLPELFLIAWCFFGRKHVGELVDEVISRNLGDFVRDNEHHARNFMVNVQSTLHCCGRMGIRDYQDDDQRNTCLKEDGQTHYITGCKHALAKIFMENIFIVCGVEVVHLLVLILGMVAAIKVWKQIRKETRNHQDITQPYYTTVDGQDEAGDKPLELDEVGGDAI